MINSSILEGGEKSKKITKKKNIMLREYLTIEFNMKQWA